MSIAEIQNSIDMSIFGPSLINDGLIKGMIRFSLPPLYAQARTLVLPGIRLKGPHGGPFAVDAADPSKETDFSLPAIKIRHAKLARGGSQNGDLHGEAHVGRMLVEGGEMPWPEVVKRVSDWRDTRLAALKAHKRNAKRKPSGA